MRDLKIFFAEDVKAIRKSPVSAVVLVLLGFGIGHFWYREHIAVKDERMAMMQQRIDDYSERLGLVPRDVTTYSRLTNEELKQAVAEFIGRLEDFVEAEEIESDSKWNLIRERVNQAELDREKNQIMRQYVADMLLSNSQYEAKFRTEVRPEAINLREEMLSRLPEQPKGTLGASARAILDYGMLAGPDPTGDLSAYLNKLVNLLP